MQVSPGSQVLLDNAERYGLFLARSLNDTNPAQVLSRRNIGIQNHSLYAWLGCRCYLLNFFLIIFSSPCIIVISTKQFDSANMDVASLNNEVFPMEEDLVNFTQQISPAQISIPSQVLLEETSRSGTDGKLCVLMYDQFLTIYLS